MRAVALVLLAACSSTPEEKPFVPLAPPEHGMQFTLQAQVKTGEERFFCRWVQLPGGVNVVTRMQSQYTSGSHHFLLYKTDPEDPISPVPTLPREDIFDCYQDSPMKYVRGVVFGAQTPEAEINLPAGVAMQLKSQSVLLMQAHYINPSPKDLEVTVRVNLEMGSLADVQQEAGTLFFYNPAIYVPAQATAATATMSCPVPSDITLLGAGSHMHRRGVGYVADALLPGGAAERLYQTDDWADPAPARFPGGKLLPQGSRINFTCTYANPSDAEFYQGNSAEENEMCMFVSFYYPRLFGRLDEFCYGGRIVGSGTATCGESMDCFQGCADSRTSARCVVGACPSAGEGLEAIRACARQHCSAECGGGSLTDIGYYGSGCSTCISAQCSAEKDACRARSCGG